MIVCKGKSELETMRQANIIVARVLERLEGIIRPGVSTLELDVEAVRLIHEAGGTPTFKGYRGFPANICVSVNDEIVHGIPGERRLREGDIVSVDVGVTYKGFVGDSARTYPVGAISPELETLLRVTREALYVGIGQIEAGRRVSDISAAIQEHVEGHGFSVVREFVGHGVGRALHEDPQVPNFGKPGRGPRLRPGMVLAIEPMVNAGGAAVRVRDDRWTAVTADGRCSAHFEHSVAVTEDRPWILSEWNGQSPA